MVNFRYHLVSLIAVFLALAAGVVLGAGPLQKQISGEASVSVAEQLSAAEKKNIDLEETSGNQEEFIAALGAEVLPGRLSERTVALLLMPGTSEGDVDSIVTAFESAGATVIGKAQLGEAAVSMGQREYRESLAAPVAGNLPDGPGATADATLARAIISTLTSTGAQRDLVAEILADAQTPLLLADSLPTEPAQAVALIGPGAQGDIDPDDISQATAQSLEALASAVASAPGGGVAVGSAASETDMIAVLRSANVPVATVDSIGTAPAAINAPLALVAGSGAYGTETGAESPVAPLP